MPQTTERVTFTGSLGARLTARLEHPSGAARAHALFAHCFTCSKDLRAARWLSKTLAARGIAVLRFDFTGLGESDGDFADTDFSSNLDDLVAAADYLRSEHGAAPQILIGHSLGGAAVIAAAERVPESVAVATIGAPSDTEHLRDTLLRGAPELRDGDRDRARVTLAGRPFTIRRQLLDDLAEEHLDGRLERLGRALLVFHSPIDAIVSIDHARRLYTRARHPKSFVAIDGADHLLTRERDARFVAEVLASWAGRYVDDDGAAAADAGNGAGDDVAAAPGEVVVDGGASGFRTRVVAGGHELTADEPPPHGGGAGPNPYDFLLTALGTCTSMTLRMYADRKGWPLEGVRVRLRHEKIHAADCAECETETGKVDRIHRRLELSGPLDDGQRTRLAEIADRCPVHRTLSGEIAIATTLA